MEIKIQMVVDGAVHSLSDDEGMGQLLAALRIKRDYRGAEPKNSYGDVDIEIDGVQYTLRVGTKEWLAAETAFKLKGAQAILRHINGSETAMAEFYRIALTRHGGKDLKPEKIAELMDFRPEEGKPSLKDALERCLNFSKPAMFSDEEVDPKAKVALEAALLALALAPTSPPESKTS